MKKQRYNVGDVLDFKLHNGEIVQVRVLTCTYAEGEWWYEITPTEFNSITREVNERRLLQYDNQV